MRLYTGCPQCGKEMKVRNHFYENRYDIIKAKGERFALRCANCNRMSEISVREIKAEEGKGPVIVLVMAIIISLALLIYFSQVLVSNTKIYIGWIIFGMSIPFMLYRAYKKEESRRTVLFNQS